MGIILIDPAWAGFYLRRTAKCYYLQEEKRKRELFPRVFWKCSTFKRGEWIVDLGEHREMMILLCEQGHVCFQHNCLPAGKNAYDYEKEAMASEVRTLES